MIKSMNAWATPKNVGYEEMFRDYAEAGFQGVELCFEQDPTSEHVLTLSTSDDELKEIRAMADCAGIQITSICAALLGGSLGCESRNENEWGKKAIVRQLEMAKILGCRSVLVYPSGFSDKYSLDKAYKRALESFQELRDDIDKQDVLVGLENADQFFLSPYDYARFIDDIGSDKVGAYLDFANIQIFQYPYSEHWLEILGKRVNSVHIKDYKPLGLGLGVFVPLLAGEVPYKRIMPMLREIGYDGPLVAELPNMMPTAPKYLYKIASEALDVIMSF